MEELPPGFSGSGFLGIPDGQLRRPVLALRPYLVP